MKDEEGIMFMSDKNDPRYLSGELVSHSKGTKKSDECKKKMGEKSRGRNKGEKSPYFNTIWIYNTDLEKNSRIKKDLSIPEGWVKGRKNGWGSINL